MAAPDDNGSAAPAPASKPRTKPKGGLKPRLSIPITDDGGIAFDALTPKVRERVQRMLDQAPAAAAAGASPDEPPAAPAGADTRDGEIVGRLYDLLGYVLVRWGQGKGLTPAQLAVLPFTPAEKAQLGPSTGLVLDKYLPGGLDRFGPEFVLGSTLLIVGIGKIEALQQLAPARDNVRQFPEAAAAAAAAAPSA